MAASRASSIDDAIAAANAAFAAAASVAPAALLQRPDAGDGDARDRHAFDSDADDQPRHAFDTNADILPARRKGGAGNSAANEEEEEKPMSKRKKRKLEQLRLKRESRETRSAVLQELKTVQLTSDQAALMRASQSTRLSRKDEVAMARRRIKAGVPLSENLEQLRQRQVKAKAAAQGSGKAEEGEEAASSDEDAARNTVKVARALAPTPYEIRRLAAPTLSAPAPMPGGVAAKPSDTRTKSVSATAAKLQPAATDPETEPSGKPVAALSSSAPDPAVMPVRSDVSAAEVPAQAPPAQSRSPPAWQVVQQPRAAEEPKAASQPVLVPQPLKPVRVCRRDQIDEQRSRLPAVMVEQELVEIVLGSDVTLVCGDTGCGKSTQVPQFLYEAGFCEDDQYLIGVTQPRRVAAISVSQRVGDELNDPGKVGYQVRYDSSHCGPATRIKFMTDGILLREVQADFMCRKYSAIVIDEAHERGVNCDILIGLLSRAVVARRQAWNVAVEKGLDKVQERPASPLRLIIMSATLRLCDFTENRQLFPSPPPVVRIDARTFPVTVHFARSTEQDYIKAAHKTVLKLHKQLPPGTVLVFVTGRQEVRRLCHLLRRSSAEAERKKALGDNESEDDGEAMDDGESGQAELLEGSDDEGGEFDDTLDTKSVAPAVPASGAPMVKGKKGRTVASALAEDDKMPKKVKKGKRRTAPKRQSVDANEEAAVPKRKAKVKKKKKRIAASEPDSAAPKVKQKLKKSKRKAPAVEVVNDFGSEHKDSLVPVASTAPAAEAEEELDINFNLDGEEDVRMLNDAEAQSRAEDQKDFEAKREGKLKMAKLDKSRTANGAFKGAGFGEGPLRVLPLFAQLPAREQMAPFADPPEGARVVVVATNVAETSVTLPNVRYVVDCGHEKRRVYRAASGVSAFRVERISKASSDQRAGRAGRLGPGHAYRLYSAAAYENYFHAFAPISILHTPLDPVLLLLASLGVPRLDVFPWPTPPGGDAVVAASRRLRALGAIADAPGEDDKAPISEMDTQKAAKRPVKCTPLGFRLSTIPVAPRYARMLLAAVTASEGLDEKHIVGHACALVAALSVGNLTAWESPTGLDDVEDPPAGRTQEHELVRAQKEAARKLAQAQEKQAPRWSQLRDDAEGLLWLMGGYAWAASVSEEAAENFCKDNRANSRQIAEAHSLMQQLGTLLQRRLALSDIGIELELPLLPKPLDKLQAAKLRDCVVEGLIDRVAVACAQHGRHAYVCADLGRDSPVFIHSSSNGYRYRPKPPVLVFNEIISSNKPYMRDCIAVDPMSLARRAANGTCSMFRLGEFLPLPAPRYLREQDEVLAFASPRYAPLDHTLPTVEVKVPADQIFRYKVFAQALLQGEVIPGIPPKDAALLARPPLVLQAPNNPRVLGIVGPLWQRRVGSRAELIRRWQEEPRFLLEGYLKWLPATAHDDVRISWPPLRR